MYKFYNKLHKKWFLYLIIGVLALIPFFWLKPGEMDLGGDATRLYFYDPLSYLRNYSLYAIEPLGTGRAETNFYILPAMLLFLALKSLFQSPYLVISLFNSFKLVIAFLAIYAIIKELIEPVDEKNNLRGELAGILAGIFYIFFRGMINQWNLAYLSQDQVFLNPLIFYLTLKYFLTNKTNYLWLLLIITFVFAHSFAWGSAPPFFAFYPFAILFLVLYILFVRKRKLPWKGIFLGLFIFLGLHSFHLMPTVKSLFDPVSNINSRIFDREVTLQQLDYFFGVLPSANLSNNMLVPSFIEYLPLISVAPFVVLLGLLLHRAKKTLLLTGVFFLITLYLLSAKVGHGGVQFYTLLFKYVPAFSMFRNFVHQWQSSFSFFYALLFGQALYLVLSKLSMKYVFIFSLTIGLLLVISAWPFINGSLVKKDLYRTPDVKNAVIMDPKYEETLLYIKSLPDDAKILTLPFTDYNYQVVHGVNNGAYMGLSTIAFLAGKKDFAGFATIAPFSEVFRKLAKEKDYEKIKRMLGLLNIRYIYYNKDPLIYDTTFPTFPYEYMRKYFPNDQKGYENFVDKLTTKKLFERGQYGLYEVDEQYFLPHFFVPDEFITYDNNPKFHPYFESASSFFNSSLQPTGTRSVYIDKESCKNVVLNELCKQKNTGEKTKTPKIYFEKINQTKYRVKVFDAHEPFVLVFSEAFNPNWKAFIANTNPSPSDAIQSYFDGDIDEGKHKDIFFDPNTFETLQMESIKDSKHFQINGYANAWYITPRDTAGVQSYELIIEMTQQRIFYMGLIISSVFLAGCIIWGIKLFVINKANGIISSTKNRKNGL